MTKGHVREPQYFIQYEEIGEGAPPMWSLLKWGSGEVVASSRHRLVIDEVLKCLTTEKDVV